MSAEPTIGFVVHTNQSFEHVLESVTAALKAEGFGILTRIDVHTTLKEKLNQDFRKYSILGACNPPLAHKAISSDPVIGLMLPCNITVEAHPDGGTVIRIANPEVMMQVGNLNENTKLREIAREARARLERVAESLTPD